MKKILLGLSLISFLIACKDKQRITYTVGIYYKNNTADTIIFHSTSESMYIDMFGCFHAEEVEENYINASHCEVCRFKIICKRQYYVRNSM